MLATHGTRRLQDKSLEYMGYFTDNGGFYDAGYWPVTTLSTTIPPSYQTECSADLLLPLC